MMKKLILAATMVIGVCASAHAEKEGEWLPVRESEGRMYSIYSNDYAFKKDVFKNKTGQVWMRGTQGESLRVLHGRSDCKGEVITIDYDYLDGTEDRTVKQIPIEAGKTSELINKVICTELNIGD